MKKYFVALLSVLVLGAAAYADSTDKLTGIGGVSSEIADYMERNLIYKDTNNDLRLPLSAGKKVVVTEAQTPVARIVKGVPQPALPVFTPSTSLTPTAVLGPINVIQTAAPTLASGLLPTPSFDGQKVEVFHGGASPFVVMAAGTPVVNLGASRRINMATRTQLVCKYSSAFVSWICDLLAAGPTPAA